MEKQLMELETPKEPCENAPEENHLASAVILTNDHEQEQEHEDVDDDVALLSNHNNQGAVIRQSSFLTKQRTLIGCNIVLLSIVLLLIFSKISNRLSSGNPQSATISNTTTTATVPVQSSTTIIETLTFSPKPCPIPPENATWDKRGTVFINRLNRCLANEYSLYSPRDLFIDDIHDTLYVADTNNDRIQKYSLNEIYNTQVGATGVTVARKNLLSPQSVFVDVHTEDMYILDFDQKQMTSSTILVSYRVHLWKKNEKVGRILFREAGDRLFGKYRHHLTMDKQRNIYVGTRSFIKKWLASTNYTGKVIVAGKYQVGSNRSTDLSDPVAFFVTDDLTLYIADWNNRRIQKWIVNATEGTTVIGNLTYVIGITMDCNGYLYYVETYDHTIYQVNMMTNQTRIIARLEDDLKRHEYHSLSVVKIDKFGNLFAIGHDQVYKFSIVQK